MTNEGTEPMPRGVRRREAGRPKGRRADAEALARLRALLGDRPRRRDLLIEHLHLLQDARGALYERDLAALAEEMRLSQAEVYEVASFYAHFDILRDGEAAPPPVTVRVCDGIACRLAGAEDLIRALPEAVGSQARVVRGPCMGACHQAPAAMVGRTQHGPSTVGNIAAAVAASAFGPAIPAYRDLAAYRAEGGYGLLSDCLTGRTAVDQVLAALDDSALRGLGGAGFPTGRKWRAVRGEPKPRLMAVNADEGEPGTFKDRHFLETDPHRVLEGMLIAAWAVEAEEIYIYLRDEYPACREILSRELAALADAGLLAGRVVHLRRGAGAYICGEESAMLESIEGKRGLPRQKPPFPSQAGLFGRPTLINNVETLFWVRDILEKGPEWFAAQGRRGRKGLRAFSVSGRVRVPGVKVAPAGITARELIEEYCGGMAAGHVFTAYLPGGASGGILPAALADLPLDFGTLEPHGCFVGSGGIVALSDRDDVKDAALNLLRFFEHESCGQCTPCRVGTEKAAGLLSAGRWDRPLLADLARVMADASICGLGQAAMNPVLSVLRHFPEAIEGEGHAGR